MEVYILVAAIDIGTTYSGYAFSTLSDFKQDPLMINTNKPLSVGSNKPMSFKIPTCLLLDRHRNLVSFGYEAQNDYADLVLDGEHQNYYYFSNFKMELYNAKESVESMSIKDINGRGMLAVDVFAAAIAALKEQLLSSSKTAGANIQFKDIRWVLTVPAIWSDKAKQLMRKSANQAGIGNEQLLIALEPEAASIYYQYDSENIKNFPGKRKKSEIGQQYMVVDIGGGKTDITVHEKLTGGHLKELVGSTGRDCGGTSVDKEFVKLLKTIMGAPIINKLKDEDPVAYLDLLTEFEMIKGSITNNASEDVSITLPYVTSKQGLKSMIETSQFGDKISLSGNKLRVDAEIIKSLFKKTSDCIVALIKEAFQMPAAKNVPLVLLVGGAAESPLIQSEVKEEFRFKRVISPENANMLVLKGAVLFGHKPNYITSRVMRLTYGTNLIKEFDPRKYPESRKVLINGRQYCDTIFSTLIKRDEVVSVEKKTTIRLKSLVQNRFGLQVFASKSKQPEYIDEDGCRLIYDISVETPCLKRDHGEIEVEFTFGNTEIQLSAKETFTGQTCNVGVKYF